MIEQCPNGAWVIVGDSHIGAWVREKGLAHDAHMSGIIRYLIREHGIKTCVDAGANIGTLTRVMLDEGCEVMAFEPNPDAFNCLRKNCPEADSWGYALSDKDSEIRVIKDANAGACYCEEVIISHEDHTLEEYTMDAIQLDDIMCAFAGVIGLFKADCEGFEPKVLRGSRETILKHRPFIICEVNQGALLRAQESRESLFAILDELGYPEANRTILQPQQTLESEIYDILCRP